MKKNFDTLKSFELSKKEQKSIIGSKTYCRAVTYEGQGLKQFCSESKELTDSWFNAWISLGAHEFIIYQI